MGAASSIQEQRHGHGGAGGRSGARSGPVRRNLHTPSIISPLTVLLKSNRTYCDAAPPPPPPLPPAGGGATKQSVETKSSNAPPPPPSSPQEDEISNAAASVMQAPLFPNPGPYESALMDSKRLLNLDTHDGFRVDINKQLSPYMAVVHSFWLGTAMLPDGRTSTYTFLTQVADEEGFMMARFDPARMSLDGRIHRAVLGGMAMMKLQFAAAAPAGGDPQQQQQPSNDQLLGELDFGGGTWTANLKYGSMGGGNVFGCNYFQHINKRWAFGGEGMYLSANKAMVSSYTVKYSVTANDAQNNAAASSANKDESKALTLTDLSSDNPLDARKDPKVFSLAAQVNPSQQMVSLNYCQEVTPRRVTLGAQLEFSPMSLESQVVVGAEFRLTRSKMTIVADLTQGCKLQSQLEANLGMAPGSPKLNLSAEVDHAKDVMRFGYGLNIGG
jgi:mitochondrial import receptor subunit TOM40